MFYKYLLLLALFLLPWPVWAELEYRITTPLPGINGNSTADIGTYVATLFQLGLAVVGLVAFGMIVFNGVKYVAAGANVGSVNDAKDGILQAIYGVILLLASVTILNTINPCIIKTVNFWSNRSALEQTCSNSGLLPSADKIDNGSSNPTKEDLLIKELAQDNNLGLKIRNLGGTLEITYIDAGTKTVTSVNVHHDGSYEAFTITGNESNPLSSGSTPNSIPEFGFDPIDALGNESLKKIGSNLFTFLTSGEPSRLKPELVFDTFSITSGSNSDIWSLNMSIEDKMISGAVIETLSGSSCTLASRPNYSNYSYWFCTIIASEKDNYVKRNISSSFYLSTSPDSEPSANKIKNAFISLFRQITS